jgi:hypothetical protein
MNTILIAAGAVLMIVGILPKKKSLQTEKDSGSVSVSKAKIVPNLETVDNEEKRSSNETNISNSSGDNIVGDMGNNQT